ncbi:hypothetical protein BJX99DRAFT_259082 [Aspergillus californicus]
MADKQPPNTTAGIPDEDLWKLIRRFDKQVAHVQAVPGDDTRPSGLDLNRSENENLTLSKLQKTIERFYISVIVKANILIEHVNRLRSWKEPRRTGYFGAVYLVAWLCDLLIPVITGTLVAMIFCVPLRYILFPAASETETETETQPSDSQEDPNKPIHRTDTDAINSAPQVHAGEATEAEAANFAQSFTEPFQPEVSTLNPGTSDIAPPIPADGEIGKLPAPPKKKTSPAVRVTLTVLSDISDICEKISNLLSPSPPFGLIGARIRVASILISVFLVSINVSSHMIVKGCSLTAGFIFFGDPVLSRAMDFVNRNIPNWKDYLDMQKTLLKGVPTNAQLTLTLLRIGELNSSPLPVPPESGLAQSGNQSIWQIFRRKPKATITDTAAAAEHEIEEEEHGSSNTDQASITTEGTTTAIAKPKAKAKKWLRVFQFARRAIKTAIKGHLALNQAMAITGSGYAKAYAKEGLRAILDKNGAAWMLSPSLGSSLGLGTSACIFEAKFERKRGTAVLDVDSDSAKEIGSPILYFTSKQSGKFDVDDLRIESQKSDAVMFQISLAEIRELKKTEGLGWKGKLIVQLAAGTGGNENSVNEGLIIQGLEDSQTYHLTDLRGRNRLFNRLVAGGEQFWEMY